MDYIPALPNPMFNLSRYNTRQLLAWLEDTAVRRYHFWEAYKTAECETDLYRESVRCAAMGNKIYVVLRKRKKQDMADKALVQTYEDCQS